MFARAISFGQIIFVESFAWKEFWYGVVSGAIGGVVLFELIKVAIGL